MTFWHDRPCECAYEISNDMGSPSSPDLKSPSHRALSLVHCGTKYSGRFVLPVGRQYRPGIQFKLHVGVATPGGSVSCFPSSNDPDRPLLLCKSYYTETLTGTGQFLRRFGVTLCILTELYLGFLVYTCTGLSVAISPFPTARFAVEHQWSGSGILYGW